MAATAAACSAGGGGAREAAAPSAPSEFEARFDVERPIGLVAGSGSAWVLMWGDTDASLVRIDSARRSTEVARLSGQSFGMTPSGDGVVVTRLACAAEECEATAVEVLALDAAGKTVAEGEFAREFGGLESDGEGRGVELVGLLHDVVWVGTSGQLVGHDLGTGRTTVAEPAAPGAIACALEDGLYTLVVDDEEYGASEMLVVPGVPEPEFDVEIRRLDDEGSWVPVPGSRRGLPYDDIALVTCAGGGMRAGSTIEASPVWSPGTGWVERGRLRSYPDLARAPEPLAQASGDQVFVLEDAGRVRRWFAGPDGPMSSEVLEMPADLFVQPYAPQAYLMVDVSDTVVVGCVQQQAAAPTARCWIGSR